MNFPAYSHSKLVADRIEYNEAHYELHKWLNEDRTTDLNREALAKLLWYSRQLIGE